MDARVTRTLIAESSGSAVMCVTSGCPSARQH